MEPIQSVGDGCPMDGIFALENGLCQGTGQQYNYKEELHVLKGEGCAQLVDPHGTQAFSSTRQTLAVAPNKVKHKHPSKQLIHTGGSLWSLTLLPHSMSREIV